MWRALLLCLLATCGWSVATTINYRAYVSSYPLLVAIPSSYSSPSLVITLHGAGETGDGSSDGTLIYSSSNQIAATLVHGALQCVNGGVTWFADHNVIVAAPQTTASWSNTTLNATRAALIAEFGCNPSRVMICGLSLGGGGAWNYASHFPANVYSCVPVAAASAPGAGSLASTFAGIKTYYVSDGNDGTVPQCWNYGTTAIFTAQPYLTAWLYEITGVCPLDNHPDSPTYSVHASYPNFNGVTGLYSSNWNGSAWAWTSGATVPTGMLGTTLYPTGGHGGWDATFGTGPSDFNTAMWTWALGVTSPAFAAGILMGRDE